MHRAGALWRRRISLVARAKDRVGDFLVALLLEATQLRYESALERFHVRCSDRGCDFAQLEAGEIDLLAADHVLDLHDEDFGVTEGHYLIVALHKRQPSLRLPILGKVVARWRAETPLVQALAVP